ncbi:hypothetical protein EYF80_030053 [Liparis tanakae]|uniref:Uncharacterized protein n=1 Tax=Liparis tanakae TaxID=230148 RepID=A0A4Z2H461_9TELE|nr:hypothetical protein EYF80_030053 [Liparis tanakae]
MASVGPEVSVVSLLHAKLVLLYKRFSGPGGIRSAPVAGPPVVNREDCRRGGGAFPYEPAAASPAVSLLLCWTGGQLNVQEDAAPRNMNTAIRGALWAACGRRVIHGPGLASLSCFYPLFVSLVNDVDAVVCRGGTRCVVVKREKLRRLCVLIPTGRSSTPEEKRLTSL